MTRTFPAPWARCSPATTWYPQRTWAWEELSNGELLSAAEIAGFAAILTADQNIRYQQNLKDRRLALVVLSTNHWPTLQAGVDRVLEALAGVGKGSYVAVSFPRPARR